MTPPADSLDVVLEGAINFREVSTVVVDGGARRLRRGVLFRSGGTHLLGAAALAHLFRDRGVRSIIDLRTARELARVGLAPFEAAGIGHYHAPMQDPTERESGSRLTRLEEFRAGRFDWAACYLRIAGAHGAELVRAFELVARAAPPALVVHCAAGRDRTGLTIALVLAALGATADDIADDYHRSGERLVPHVAHFTAPPGPNRLAPHEVLSLLETERDSMLRFLAGLTRAHGSVVGFLSHIGVDEHLIADLRARLLEPAPAD